MSTQRLFRTSIAPFVGAMAALFLVGTAFAWPPPTCTHTTQYYVDNPSYVNSRITDSDFGNSICLNVSYSDVKAADSGSANTSFSCSSSSSYDVTSSNVMTYLEGNGNSDSAIAQLESQIVTALLTLNCEDHCSLYNNYYATSACYPHCSAGAGSSIISQAATDAIDYGRACLQSGKSSWTYGWGSSKITVNCNDTNYMTWTNTIASWNSGGNPLASCDHTTLAFTSRLVVIPAGNALTLRWATPTIHNVMGYNVFAGQHRLNVRLLPPSATSYHVATPVHGATYRLQVIQTDGVSHFLTASK
jgi:hypothetical protein